MRGKYAPYMALFSAGSILLLAALSGHGVPCLFRLVTGFRCPGCGITTLCLSLLKGDVAGAFAANPFLFVTLPLFAGFLLAATRVPERGAAKPLFYRLFPAGYLAALLLFGVLRNVIR